MKTRHLFLLGFLALMSFAPHVLAQFVPLAPIPGLTNISPTTTIDQNTLTTFFNNLYKYLIGLAATLAVIEIIWGGLEISTKDSVSKQSDGKERITQAIFGLVLVLSPVLVFSIINPSIINLSLNLPEIKLDVPATSQQSLIPGGSASCDPTTNTDNAACRQQLVDACVASGGTPVQTFDAQSSKTLVTCQPAGSQPTQVTASQCTAMGNVPPTGIHDGQAYSTGQDCSSAKAVQYIQTLKQSCVGVIGGGFCLYTK